MLRRFLKPGKKEVDTSKKEPLINSDDPEAVEIAQVASSGLSPFDSTAAASQPPPASKLTIETTPQEPPATEAPATVDTTTATKPIPTTNAAPAMEAVEAETPVNADPQEQQQQGHKIQRRTSVVTPPSMKKRQGAGGAAAAATVITGAAAAAAVGLTASPAKRKEAAAALSNDDGADIVSLAYSRPDEKIATQASTSNAPACSDMLQDFEKFTRDVKNGAMDVIGEGSTCERAVQAVTCQPPSSTKAASSNATGGAAGDDYYEIETKIPTATGLGAFWARFAAIPALVKVGAAVAGLASVAVVALIMLPHRQDIKPVSAETNLTVAFVGTSLLFINDIPRLVEAVSGEHITQNSCLHARGSLAGLLLTGNGMYYRWRTDKAVLSQSVMSNGRMSTIYDLGACSIPQLLLGVDNDLSYANQNGLYYNDGNNPCIKDYMYYRFMKSINTTSWDFVVLNEQTKRMAVDAARSASLDTIEKYYVPFLLNTTAIPVVLQPYAYWSDSSNMTGLTDVATFTSLIYAGSEEYAVTLKEALPSSQTPRVAPVGLSFLVVHEEDHDLWEKLFGSDGVHASLHGSYVIALALYATFYGKMPPSTYALPQDEYDTLEDLWGKARKLQEGGGYPSSDQYPTSDEASYLYNVVERVCIKKYKPSSLVDVNA